MHVLGWIAVGLITGLAGKLEMPGRDVGGFMIAAVLGMVGALLGGILGRGLGWYRESEALGFVAALLGAIAVLAVYHLVRQRIAGAASSPP